MQIGDKVIFNHNRPFKLKSLYLFYSQVLKGNIYTISAIEFFNETIFYTFLEIEECRFPKEWFIPYEGLGALIERRRNVWSR